MRFKTVTILPRFHSDISSIDKTRMSQSLKSILLLLTASERAPYNVMINTTISIFYGAISCNKLTEARV